MSACKTSEEQTDLDTYDYYLLIVESRQSLSQGNYLYIMHEAGKPLTSDSITYESDELWSGEEFDYNYFFNKYCTVGELHENK